MKKIIKEIIVIFIVILLATNIISYFRTKDINTSNLITTLKDYKSIDGVNIKELLNQNKPLIINFWGTWCPICNQEISTISKIAKDKDVVLITIAVNSGSNEDIKKYLKSKNANFLVINDNSGSIAKDFNITTYPTTLFFNSKRDKVIKDSGYLTYGGYLVRKKLVEN